MIGSVRSAHNAWLLLLLALVTTNVPAQVLLDDFNRPNNAVVGGGWTEGGGQRGEINTNRLRFVTGGVQDREWVQRNVTGQYNVPFAISTCALEWSFNMRQTRADPSGFDANNYGMAVVLGGTSGDFNTGQGYAIVHGQAGAIDPIRLVRYNGGMDGNSQLTNVVVCDVAPFTDIGNQYIAVRVVYEPSTHLWTIHGQVIDLAGMATFNPSTLNNPVGSGTDNTYTSENLLFTGVYWNHSTAAGDGALLDNFYGPVSCPTIPPTVNFTTAGAVVLEDVGVVNATLGIFPASAVAGTITVALTNGPGAIYGSDYTTIPDGSGGTMVLNVAAGQNTITVPISIIDDLLIENTETVTFTITGATGGITIGTADQVFTLTIGDNDSPATVLQRGDLVIVGINANNGACSGVSAEDEVSFFCFRDITAGTTLDLTDNGYERCNPGLWSDNEGTLRMTRTGPTIPAGSIITIRIGGTGSITGLVPDNLWNITTLSATSFLNLSSSGDQLFFMQGGNWVDPPGAHNATYTGEYLYGFSTNGLWLSGQCTTPDANSHSGLPLQMECFSMEPTTASDWAKYTGPTTATNQRGWLIRIGDPANWTSYANCAAYNSSTPNYGAPYTFVITTIGFTAGLWTGGVNTDWFDCRNWDDARVPVATDNVRIDQSALRNCVVGLSPGSSAECASLIQSNAGGANRQLTVQQGSALQVFGPLRIERLVAGTALSTTVLDYSVLRAASVEIEGVTSGNFEAVLRCEQPGGLLVVESNLTIGPGALLDLQSTLGNSGRLELGGDFINQNSEAAFQDNFSTVVLIGNGDQSISAATGPEVFYDLVIDKAGGDAVLASPVEVRNALGLNYGRILSSATELLTMRAGSAVFNASDFSHVDGPMQKFGNTAFGFPVGKGNVLRPCSLSAVTGGSSVAFTAEYFAASPRTTFNNILEPSLDHISDCEYWMIDRSAGTPNAIVTLSWREPMSCGVTDLPSLRVARWDGSMWLDRGNNVATGTTLEGFIPTAAVQTEFSPWTLASVNSQNPLPITLLSFTATPVQRNVLLDWTTATETDNDFFTVERSADGNSFLPLFRVEGAGEGTSFSALHYRMVDYAPLSGQSYYRLRQTDLDGTTTVSHVVSVWMGGTGSRPLAVHIGADMLTAFHGFGPGARYTLLDMTGRLIATGTTQQEGTLLLPVSDMPAGAYLLRMEDERRMESTRFIR